MTINSAILADRLRKWYDVLQFGTPSKASLRSFRVYDGSPVRMDYLYILRPEELLFLRDAPQGAVLLCPGVEAAPEGLGDWEVLAIPAGTDSAQLINRLHEIFDFFNDWEEALDSCERSIQGIRQMLEASRPVLGGSLILADYHFNYVACTRDFEAEVSAIRRRYSGQTPPYIVEELLTNPEYIRVQNSREVFEYPIHNASGMVPALCLNLFRPREEEYRGRLLFAPDTWPCPGYAWDLLRYVGEKVNAVYSQLSDHSLLLSSLNGLRELITKGLDQGMGSVSLVSSILKYARWNLTDDFQLLKLMPVFLSDAKEINAVSRNQLELIIPNSCAVIHGGCIIVVINHSRNREELYLHEMLSQFLRDHLYKVGISSLFQDFTMLPSAHLEADAALTLGNSRDNMFWYYQFSDYSLDYMLSKCQENIDRQHLCLPGLLRLKRYDESHGTAYTQALKTYMEERYSITHTAEKLFIHRTTLLKHLKKISELSGLDLEDWNTRLHLMLSFHFLNG